MKAHDAVSYILKEISSMAKPGMTTRVIDDRAGDLILKVGCTSYNKGYKPEWATTPYPAHSCISRNNEIAHGVPDDLRPLREGDIVSFDLGIKDADGNCGDAALSIGIGEISNRNKHLLKYAKRVLDTAISILGPGVDTKLIAETIQLTAGRHNFKVNRGFSGHGIGTEMHMQPKIYNTTEPAWEYTKLAVGQKICIEPILTTGKDDVGENGENGWTRYTRDGGINAFFEHMIEITETGYKVLTTHI